MIRFCFASVTLILSGTLFGEYKEGWTHQNFYEAVTSCRSAIIFPAAKDYEETGLKHGQTRLAMHNESIAMTPVFEGIASDTCYCALNEYAQDYMFSDAKIRKMAIDPFRGRTHRSGVGPTQPPDLFPERSAKALLFSP